MEALDAVDRRIVRELQQDGTLSQTALAERVGASAASCWRRVRALEQKGVLTRIVRLADARSLGLQVTVFCQVRLQTHLPANSASFERLIADRPEIVECHAMSGEWDYLLQVVATDVSAYETFLRQVLLAHESVATTSSNFALSVRKYSTALPI